MISAELLEILRCPQNRTQLTLADAQLIERLNQQIAAGQLKTVAGQCVESALDGGLIREDGMVFYPIVNGIPVLLIDEGITLEQVK